MNSLNLKLSKLFSRVSSGAPIKIMIFGLGSVGSYLLDYLLSWSERNVELHVCGRSFEKAQASLNVARMASIIRDGCLKTTFFHQADFNEIDLLAQVIHKVSPDFLVNTSRVYSGLKYGAISWKAIRAYGLWTPLSARFIRNIMIAYERAGCSGIVINTSYPDAVNPWLKSAGLSCPDFGSGNLNHLVPRMKQAALEACSLDDISQICVVLATSHFHDVVISKEGQTEGINPLVSVTHSEQRLDLDMCDIYRKCAILMPIDARRNVMNASSNFELISKIIQSIRSRSMQIIHSPGVCGYIGGYPVRIDFRIETKPAKCITFVEDFFSLENMVLHNRSSIFLDGIDEISNGVLTFTNELRKKVERSFGVDIPRSIHIEQIERVSSFIIDKIIEATPWKHK